jgi:hypothetical protein
MKALVWILFLGWASFLYWGVKSTTGSVPTCSATRALPQNHLLGPKDLKCTGSDADALYVGLYLKQALDKDSRLKPEEVSDDPLLHRTPGTKIFTLVLAGDDPGKLDAGQVLDLGTGMTVIAGQSRVIAVSCWSRASGKCEAIFEIEESKWKPLVEASPVVIISNPKIAPQ